jgi:clan AA aspartic protease
MGKVMNIIKLTSYDDLVLVEAGHLAEGGVRSVEVEGLVDTGATTLVIPEELQHKLGLKERERRKVRYANGQVAEIAQVSGLVLEILGRRMHIDALVQPDLAQPLIGQIVLEALDLIVDPKSRDLLVNPASPDMPTLDMLAVAPEPSQELFVA